MMNCPLNNNTYTGNCENCNERVDCMLRDIMHKMETMETTIAQLKATTAS